MIIKFVELTRGRWYTNFLRLFFLVSLLFDKFLEITSSLKINARALHANTWQRVFLLIQSRFRQTICDLNFFSNGDYTGE